MTSIFKKHLSKEEILRVDKSSDAYSFFLTEYPKELTRDLDGDLIIRREKENLIELKKYISRLAVVGSDAYSYFINEYRQNSPVFDAFGNIIVNDEIISNMSK